jgi:hypothetical protein
MTIRRCLCVASVIGACARFAGPALASVPSGSQTFGFNNSEQFFTVPAGVTQLLVTGAAGPAGQQEAMGPAALAAVARARPTSSPEHLT